MQIFNHEFMKKKRRILGMMLLAMVVCFSCSENDDGTIAGEISFYGEKYLLEQGAIYHDNNHDVIAVEDYVFEDRYLFEGEERIDEVKGFTVEIKDKQTGNFLIGLYEQGFVLSDLTKDARGEGACICLRLASPETDRLVPGKYVYSLNHDEYTFKGYSSANYRSGSSTVPNELVEGEVEILQDGDLYTVIFNCATSTGGRVEGIYNGVLKEFDIRKNVETVNYYENIVMEALFDTISYMDTENVLHQEPDYSRATSFFATSTQKLYSANLYRDLSEISRRSIDIALAYDRENASVYFESPLKMRGLLWHNTFENETLFDYSFDLPCHTKYMPTSADFTDADFEALDVQEDFVIDFEEALVSIPVTTSMPCFLWVQTGNGLRGCIRVREIRPESSETVNGITYQVNPSIVVDMKFPRSYSEQKIR